jgi:hypothetical protein
MGEPDRVPPDDPMYGHGAPLSRRSRGWPALLWIAVGIAIVLVLWLVTR